MANPSLPHEILVEIFSRLPQKSIGKCKCLSKYWLSLLSTPNFIKLCLNHYGNLILITPSHSLHLLLSTPLINNNAVSGKLELPGSWTQVIGSCKGLVLLVKKEGELFMVNPITSLMVKIPDFDLALKKNATTITHGFGYDSLSNDYKIVTLSYYDKTFADVYSVKIGVWKRVDFPFDGFAPENDPIASGVFVNEAIHWRVYRTLNRRLIAFDLATEVFYKVSAPFIANAMWKRLVVRGGRLCVVSSSANSGSDVWTMEENGSVKSWKQIIIPGNKGWDEVRPLCFVGEELLVLTTEDGILAVYDVKEETMKAFVVYGVPDYCKDADDFVDNLGFFG